MAKAILICGKICSGKTTYAKRLAEAGKAVVLSVDEITLALFGQHLGEKHDEITEKTARYLYSKTTEIIAAGTDVILDWGFWTREGRHAAGRFFHEKDIPVEWHYVDVGDPVWRRHIEERNAKIMDGQDDSYFIDAAIAAKFSNLFEEPKREEIGVWVDNNTHAQA